MKKNTKNFTEYHQSTFITDITNLEIVDGFFAKKDIPAFIHEYCHYIQDITTISSIFGFYLLMADIVNLTQIFSTGEGKLISIPLDRDKYRESINKFRKYYNLYCGDSNNVCEIDYSIYDSFNRENIKKEVDLDGKKQILASNHFNLIGCDGKKVHFGLIVLQEIQAFYAQQMAELMLYGTEFSKPSDKLPSFPYKFGEFLFEKYNIEIDLESKFILIDLCLDTVQAPTIFLNVLEIIQGQKISYFGDNKTDFIKLVEDCRKNCSYSKNEALDNIIVDLKIWSKDKNRKYLAAALEWYLEQIETANILKNLNEFINAKTLFSLGFCTCWERFHLLYKCFPSPVYLKKGVLFRNIDSESEDGDKEFIKSFEAATTIWSHRLLYDLLCSENLTQITEKAICPLYDNCHKRKEIDDDYTCKQTPWNIIKNKKNIICQYGMAAHSFGLWQNELLIKNEC
ncbi:MAG: hypothetical protein A2X61_00860 [Ignavibacteria bacterium GWB2_35_12]|nr:MAG: hypothetical protein A2X61_00860 [Ignavibacteria bacterium GWB2_35_12]OGU87551.1 MAG: hypothetical protein A2220_15620 [Ignavibacteria bacterium RIFOXYA2_FULL_35_10]OGV21742.1 MAG: hypothetical protein A2475_04085 [Ignavibacteria bacterium RIFOXYC2_FULL_35_21]